MPTVIMDLPEPVGRSLALRADLAKPYLIGEFQDLSRPMPGLRGFYLRKSQIAALRNGHPQIVPLPAGDLWIQPGPTGLHWRWRRAPAEPFLSSPNLGILPWSLLDQALENLAKMMPAQS